MTDVRRGGARALVLSRGCELRVEAGDGEIAFCMFRPSVSGEKPGLAPDHRLPLSIPLERVPEFIHILQRVAQDAAVHQLWSPPT